MSDYTVVEATAVKRILTALQPHTVLKQDQISLGLEILNRLPSAVDALSFLALCRRVDRFRDLNYSKKRTVTSEIVERHLRLSGRLGSQPSEVSEPCASSRNSARTGLGGTWT